jgi:hypothetical protein
MDPSGFTTGVNTAVQSSKKLEGEFNILDSANRKTASGIKALGQTAAMVGMQMAIISPEFRDIGIAMSALGVASGTVGPAIRAVGFAHREIEPAIKGVTAALSAEQAMMMGVTGLLGVGLVGSIIAYKISMDEANKKIEDQKKALENVDKAAKDYLSTTQKLQTIQEKLAGRPSEKKEMELKLEGLSVTRSQAYIDLKKAKSPQELAAAHHAVNVAEYEYGKTLAMLTPDSEGITPFDRETQTLKNQARVTGEAAASAHFQEMGGGRIAYTERDMIAPKGMSNMGVTGVGTPINITLYPGNSYDIPGTGIRISRISSGG